MFIKNVHRAAAAALCLLLCPVMFGCGGPGDADTDAAPEASSEAADPPPSAPETASLPTAETPTDAAPPQGPAGEPETDPPYKPEQATLDSLARIFASYGTVGAQVAVIRDGKVLFTYEYGTAVKETGARVAPDTKYRCASLSKLAVCTVFERLCEENLASETADIGDYLGFRVRNPRYPDAALTPRMLMTHTSSVLDSSAFLSSRMSDSSVPVQTLLSSSGAFSANRPGTAYAYSNFGYALLACVCEKAAGESFETLAKRYVTGPMGIDAAFTASALEDPSLLGALYGQGGYSREAQLKAAFRSELGQTHHLAQGNFTVSAKDYARILCMLMNGGTDGDVRILREESVQSILRCDVAGANGRVGCGVRRISGVLPGTEMYAHTGSNFGMFSAFAFDPQTGVGAVVLTSGADGRADPQTGIYTVCLEAIRTVLSDER